MLTRTAILAALWSLTLAAILTPKGIAQEPDAVQRARKLVEGNAGTIRSFACPRALNPVAVTFDGYRNLKDGYEVNYTFTWRQIINDYYIRFGFLVGADGTVRSVMLRGWNTWWEPFGPREVTDTELRNLRGFMRNHSSVNTDAHLLQTVDRADARTLCELFLRLQQGK